MCHQAVWIVVIVHETGLYTRSKGVTRIWYSLGFVFIRGYRISELHPQDLQKRKALTLERMTLREKRSHPLK